MTKFAEKDSMAEKILRKIIAVVMVTAFMLPLMMPQVFAASTVTISTKDTIKGGETFTVAVIFGSGDVSRVDAQLTYNTDMLTYISGGTSSGNSGYVQLKDAGTDGSVVFNLKFQAIADGNVMLDVTTNEVYDFDEQLMENISASESITIEGDAPADAVVDPEDQEEEPAEVEDPAQQPMVLNGVDEKDNSRIILIAGIVALVLLLLIIIVAVALKKSRKPKHKAKPAVKTSAAADIDDPESGNRYEESLEEPNPLRGYKNPYEGDKMLEEELQRRREEIRQRRYEQRMAAREYAKAQTQIWDEWTLDDDDKRDTDDIEKW